MIKKTLTLITVLLLLAAWLPAYAAVAPDTGEEKEKPGKWYDRIKFNGDVRARYEGFKKEGSYDDDRRDRFRMRIRAGLTATITDELLIGIQLRNGNPNDPVSNNTSFDGGFTFKEFNLAQGYINWEPIEWVGLIGGKFDAKKRWKVSDMQWDDDVTVEGLMENFKFGGGDGAFKGIDIDLYQYLLEESGSGSDSNLYGVQTGLNFKFGDKSTFLIGAGYDGWTNPQAIADQTIDGSLDGNNMTNIVDENGMLVSEFEILNFFAEYKYAAREKWPLKITLFYYNNLGAAGIAKDEDTAYFGRLQVGDYKKKWRWAFRYSYYYSEPDALFYVFTQSDTSRASDLKAHRFDVRLGCVAKSYFNVTYYNTNTADGLSEDLHRWQVDYIIKF